MPEMIATKSLSYATRRLLPGDHFIARTDRDARLLAAIGKAKLVRVPGHIAAPPSDLAQKIQSAPSSPDMDKEALQKLRAEYTELIGKKPFAGWKAEELQKRIDEALAS